MGGCCSTSHHRQVIDRLYPSSDAARQITGTEEHLVPEHVGNLIEYAEPRVFKLPLIGKYDSMLLRVCGHNQRGAVVILLPASLCVDGIHFPPHAVLATPRTFTESWKLASFVTSASNGLGTCCSAGWYGIRQHHLRATCPVLRCQVCPRWCHFVVEHVAHEDAPFDGLLRPACLQCGTSLDMWYSGLCCTMPFGRVLTTYMLRAAVGGASEQRRSAFAACWSPHGSCPLCMRRAYHLQWHARL